MQLLGEAFLEGSAALVFHLMHPLVDCVRMTSRFADLLRHMKLDHPATYRPAAMWKPLPRWREV